MATQKKVLGNAIAQGIGKVFTAVASLIIVKIVSSFGREFYGHYLTAYEFLAFFGILADAGLFAIAVREMSQKPKDEKFVLSNIFSMRLILIVAVTLLAGISAQFVTAYPPMVKIGIWITGLSMALTIVAGTLSSVLQARMKIQYFTSALVIGKILLAGMIFAIAQYADIFGTHLFFTLLWAGVISNIVFCLLVILFSAREVAIGLGFDFAWWKKILKESLPYGLALILQTLYLRVDVILISIMLGASAVGVYGLGTRILESFLILGTFFGHAILPRISKEEGNALQGSKTLSWGMIMLMIVALPVIVGTFGFAPDITLILSSTDFLSTEHFFGSDKVMMVLVPTILFAYFNQLFTFTLVAKRRQNYLLLVNGVALLLNVVLNILFLQKYGIIAAALSTIFCEIIVFGLLLREIWQHFHIKIPGKQLLILLGINAVMAAEIWLTPIGQNFILALAFCSLTYFGLLFCGRKWFQVNEE